MSTATPVTDWATAVMTSLAAALALLLEAIPKILGFLVILIIGWFIASLLAKAVSALLRAVRFNDLAQRAGLSDFVRQMGLGTDAAGFVALIAKWFVRLIVLVSAFDALGLPAVSGVLQQLLLWLPNLVVAILALVIGGLAANALGRLVRGATAEAGLGNPDLLANVARVAVWAFAIVVAVNQLGIATTLIDTLFMATVGAVALALGLAFGLGGRETAAQIVHQWYMQGQQAAPRLQQAADSAQRQAGEQVAAEAPGARSGRVTVVGPDGTPTGAPPVQTIR
jgi:small-conductance mechanosensitive channel